MSHSVTPQQPFSQPLLTFPDAEKSPLSIRAKALVFFDPRSRRLREEMEQLAPRELPVLIRGEPGTGKELLARHIHRGSDRSGLVVSVNCGAISPTYADAELFGYAPGAHSGSASSRAGWFGSATGGLYRYLSEGRLDLPALREQPGNILPLAEYFLGIYSQRLDFEMPLISEAAQKLLEAHYWPGNTRELENVIHFALLVSSGAEILPEHLNFPARQ